MVRRHEDSSMTCDDADERPIRPLLLLTAMLGGVVAVLCLSHFAYEAVALATSGGFLLLRLFRRQSVERGVLIGAIVGGVAIVGVLYAAAYQRIEVTNNTGTTIFYVGIEMRLDSLGERQAVINHMSDGRTIGITFYDIVNDAEVCVAGCLVTDEFFGASGTRSRWPALFGGATRILSSRNNGEIEVSIE